MASKTKNKRNAEATDVWETLLTRRLADDLDSFLASVDAETFVFADAADAPKRVGRSGKRLNFKTLATIAASAALLVGVASAARFYVVSPNVGETNVETRQTGDELSLLSWSVESLSESEWARHVEATLANADVFGGCASEDSSDSATEEARLAVEENASAEEDETTESADGEWFSVETLAGVATWKPLKYEPFLQAVVASLL